MISKKRPALAGRLLLELGERGVYRTTSKRNGAKRRAPIVPSVTTDRLKVVDAINECVDAFHSSLALSPVRCAAIRCIVASSTHNRSMQRVQEIVLTQNQSN
jgi:hypothetical protein